MLPLIPMSIDVSIRKKQAKRLLVIPAPILRKKLSMLRGRFLSGFSAPMKGFIWPMPTCNHTAVLLFAAYSRKGFPAGLISWMAPFSRTHATLFRDYPISGGLILHISFMSISFCPGPSSWWELSNCIPISSRLRQISRLTFSPLSAGVISK